MKKVIGAIFKALAAFALTAALMAALLAGLAALGVLTVHAETGGRIEKTEIRQQGETAEAGCTRAEAVTFLWRNEKQEGPK